MGGVEVELYPSLPTALEGGEGSASCPGRSLPPGKIWYHLYRRLGGPQSQSGQVRKILPPPGFNPRTIQPIASRYTDWATWPTEVTWQYLKLNTCSSVVYEVTLSYLLRLSEVIFEMVFCTVHRTVVSYHFKSVGEIYFKHNEPPPISVLWFTFQWFIIQQSIPYFSYVMWDISQSQWPRSLRHRSAAARHLRFWVWIPPGAWMSVCCECCVLSGRGLCDKLITCPEESCRLWCVIMCDLETSWMRRPWPTGGCCTK
jgi:hypothetical protein